MPGTTPTFGFRYQLGADPPDGDDLGKNLAEDVEARILLERAVAKCQLVQQTAQTGWATGVATAVTFGASSEVVDDALDLHSTSSNTSRIVIGKKLGWWKLSGVYVPLNSANSTSVRAYLAKNGSAIAGTFAGFPYASSAISGVTVPAFWVQATVATDYVELIGQQNISTGTGGTVVSAPAASSFEATWMCPS